ncbi:MAG: SDR family NAD(P)-dependent oxidoreductase [Paludibacteraceae bacterium]|nr:SDR family NAD(P)-dependent oxidoreductase [Paludibacteraceae bacterium]
MYALITGASSGIGKAYAFTLAEHYRHDVLLISNQKAELEQVAQDIQTKFSVKAVPYYCNLANQDAAKEIYDWCNENKIEVDILINNAGMFFWQPLIDVAPEKIATIMNLHMFTLTMLCRYFAKDMTLRRKGWIINMASMTAWMSMPGIQCYNATKAYVNNFSKSLWYELKPFGVKVLTLTPGAIDTPLYGLDDKKRRLLVRFGISFTPEHFTQVALKRMFKGKKKAMPGWINHLAVPLINHLPDWAIFFAMKRLPQYKNIPL